MWGGKLEERREKGTNGEVENVVGFLASPPLDVKNKEIENEDATISISC